MANQQILVISLKIAFAFSLCFFMEIVSLFWSDLFLIIPDLFLMIKGAIFFLSIAYFMGINQGRAAFIQQNSESYSKKNSLPMLEKKSYFYFKCSSFLNLIFILFLIAFTLYFSNSIYSLYFLEAFINPLHGEGMPVLDIFNLNLLSTTAALFYIMRNIFLSYGYNYAAASEARVVLKNSFFTLSPKV